MLRKNTGSCEETVQCSVVLFLTVEGKFYRLFVGLLVCLFVVIYVHRITKEVAKSLTVNFHFLRTCCKICHFHF